MKLISIQYLRALAILLVVHCHAIDIQMKFGVSHQQNFYYLQNIGAIGVDIFFVISGFIIAYITQRAAGFGDAFKFIKKRFVRINPPYYLVSLFVLVTFLVNHRHFLKPLVKTLTILPVFDFGEFFWVPFLFLGWTLSFEWLFYIIYAVLIALSVKNKNIILVAILGFLTLLGLLISSNIIQVVFITNPIIWEFCFGVLIAYLVKNFSLKISYGRAFLLTGIALIALNIVYGYGEISEAAYILQGKYGWERVLLWGFPSAFVVYGALIIEKSRGVFKYQNKTLVLIGDASFSIYLTHYIIFAVLDFAVDRYNIPVSRINQDLLILILIVTATYLGILYYKVIEKFLIEKTSKLV